MSIFQFNFADRKDREHKLTVTGSVAVAAGQTGGAGDPLTHAVAHVAPRGRLQFVHHEAAAVPHGDVELGHTALPVLVDAGGGGDDALVDAGHGTCTSNYKLNYRNNVQILQIKICGTQDMK